MLAGRLALALTLAVSAPNLANAANTFQFLFDDTGGGPDGTIGPVIGHGSFVSPFNLVPGTYALSSLTGFTMIFSFGPEVFLSSDIVTPIDEVAVEITADGATTERLIFVENGSPSDGGPFAGALELVNSDANILTFAPRDIEGHNTYFLIGDFQLGGNYLALSGSVPEPPTWALILLAFGGLGLSVGKRLLISTESRPGQSGFFRRKLTHVRTFTPLAWPRGDVKTAIETGRAAF